MKLRTTANRTEIAFSVNRPLYPETALSRSTVRSTGVLSTVGDGVLL